jgi:hypothetical protein
MNNNKEKVLEALWYIQCWIDEAKGIDTGQSEDFFDKFNNDVDVAVNVVYEYLTDK